MHRHSSPRTLIQEILLEPPSQPPREDTQPYTQLYSQLHSQQASIQPAMEGSQPPSTLPDSAFGPLELPGELKERLSCLGNQFLAGVLAKETEVPKESHKENRGALTLLSQCLSLLGRHEEGLAVDLRLVALYPKHPVAHYNLACAKALTRDKQGALGSLRTAMFCGFKNVEFLVSNSDLQSLHSLDAFQALVQSMRASPREH